MSLHLICCCDPETCFYIASPCFCNDGADESLLQVRCSQVEAHRKFPDFLAIVFKHTDGFCYQIIDGPFDFDLQVPIATLDDSGYDLCDPEDVKGGIGGTPEIACCPEIPVEPDCLNTCPLLPDVFTGIVPPFEIEFGSTPGGIGDCLAGDVDTHPDACRWPGFVFTLPALIMPRLIPTACSWDTDDGAVQPPTIICQQLACMDAPGCDNGNNDGCGPKTFAFSWIFCHLVAARIVLGCSMVGGSPRWTVTWQSGAVVLPSPFVPCPDPADISCAGWSGYLGLTAYKDFDDGNPVGLYTVDPGDFEWENERWYWGGHGCFRLHGFVNTVSVA